MGRIPLLVRMFTIALVTTTVAPTSASAWMPEPVEFTRAPAASPGPGEPVTIRTERRFDMAGASWRGARNAEVDMRIRRADGSWSRWGHAAAGPDAPDAPEEARTRRTPGAPVWTGGARVLQLRADRRLSGLRIRFVNTTGTATPAQRARTRAAKKRKGAHGKIPASPATRAGTPRIVPRKQWGASRCTPRDVPSYGNARVAYVHHTVSLNNYSRDEAASMVLAICLYHRNGNGWDDIGYNLLVDRFGTIYEGRAGGVDAPVLGAQAGGFNSESTGVAVIGNYESTAPSSAAMGSLARVLAWKLSIHGIPARGRARVTSAGGPSTSHPVGTRVRVHRISGHRDVNATACPGAALYRRLPALRREVARLKGHSSRLSLARSSGDASYGTGTPVAGRLRLPDGASPAGATIELRRLTGSGPERLLATAVTDDEGNWTADLPLRRPALVRAVFMGDAARPGVTSPPAYLRAASR